MRVDIRVLPQEDADRWKHVVMTAFMDSQQHTDAWAAFHQPDWTLAAYADGAIQASASSVPFELWLEGSKVAMGGVTSVACMPEYRRQGLVAELMRRTLARSHEKGETVSGLWTPHPALYRRYGYEICTEVARYGFHPKRIALSSGPRAEGRIEESSPAAWREFDRLYRDWGRMRNSLLGRSEQRWTEMVLRDHWDRMRRASYLYRNPAGDAEGYAVLRVPATGEAVDRTLIVSELIALNGDAYRSLLALVLSHDLAGNVRWLGPPDEPLLDVIVDPAPIERQRHWGLMLRIVDLPEALSQRPVYGEGRVTLAVDDRDCPWNAGTWEVFAAGSHLVAERTDREPMLSLDARALAQLYNGYRSATTLARAGRMQVHHDRALAIADIVFAMRNEPFCADDF